MGGPDPRRGAVALLALAAGCAMAGNYALQPLLPAVARSFPEGPWVVSCVAGAGPLGYVLGLWFLVPLGDAVAARSLIAWQALGLGVCLVAEAAAPTAGVLVLACAAAGLMATVTAHCIGLAGRLGTGRAGAAVGTVVMGVSIGILAGRVGGGVLAEWLGWRAPLLALAAGMLAIAASVHRSLPPTPPARPRPTLGELAWTVPRALRREPGLLRATLVGCCWFAAFSAFWASLALHLAEPPLAAGPAAAGAFGLIGIAGAVAARGAGRASDRFGARAVVFAGLWAAGAGLLLLAAGPDETVTLALATLVLDAGCFTAHAATQSQILGGGRPGRSEPFGAYLVVYWGAGTLGAFAGPALVGAIGWRAACLAGLAAIGCGLALHARRGHMTRTGTVEDAPKQDREGWPKRSRRPARRGEAAGRGPGHEAPPSGKAAEAKPP